MGKNKIRPCLPWVLSALAILCAALAGCGPKLQINGVIYDYKTVDYTDDYEFSGTVKTTVVPDSEIAIDAEFSESFYENRKWFRGKKTTPTERGSLDVTTYFAKTGFVIAVSITDSERAYHSNTVSTGEITGFNCYFAFGDALLQSDGVYEIECTAGNRFKMSKVGPNGLSVVAMPPDRTPVTAVKREGDILEGTCYSFDIEMFLPYALFGRTARPESVFLNPTQIKAVLGENGEALPELRTWYNYGANQNSLYSWGMPDQGYEFDRYGFISDQLTITDIGGGTTREEYGYDFVIQGDTVNLYMVPEAGNRLAGLVVNGAERLSDVTETSGGLTYSFTAGGKTTVEAVYEPISDHYPIEVDAAQKGIISVPERVAVGGSLTVTVTPNTGDIVHAVMINGRIVETERTSDGKFTCTLSTDDLALKWYELSLKLSAVIYREAAINTSITATDSNGAAVDLEGKTLTLIGTHKSFDITVGPGGTLNGTVYGDAYTLFLYGYGKVKINIPQGVYTQPIALSETIAHVIDTGASVEVDDTDKTIDIRGNGIADYNGNAGGSAELVLGGEIAQSKSVTLYMTVKNTERSAGNWDWAARRFAVAMTDANDGILFFTPQISEMNIFSYSGNYATENNRFAESGVYRWMTEMAWGQSGLDLKFTRTDNRIELYAKQGSNWVKIGGVSCDPLADTKITIMAQGDAWEFSNISVETAE